MKYLDYPKEKLSNGNTIEYKRTENGTCYHKETPDKLVELLEELLENRTRITVDYGDIKTGKSWGEEHDITGYIGRSTGNIKIPLLVYNTRSYGGGALLDHCIIGIKTSKGNKELYKI